MTKVLDEDYKFGSYGILYRVYYEKYPGVSVFQSTPFTISVVDPCSNALSNSITAYGLQDLTYTITDVALTY